MEHLTKVGNIRRRCRNFLESFQHLQHPDGKIDHTGAFGCFADTVLAGKWFQAPTFTLQGNNLSVSVCLSQTTVRFSGWLWGIFSAKKVT